MDPLEHIVFRNRQTRERVLKLVADLSAEQLAWRPAPKAHSIGFTLWHLARCADAYNAQLRAALGTPAEQLWDRERLGERWGFPPALGRDRVGTLLEDEAAANLPLPPKQELLEYARRAFAALDEGAGLVRLDALELRHPSIFAPEGESVGFGLIACVTHDNRHLGEMEYVKGLLGLRGSVTL